MTTADIIATAVAVTGGLGLLIAFSSMAVARAANAISSESAVQQIQVAERELYLSLVEKRTLWYTQYKGTFLKRQVELHSQVHLLMKGNTPLPLPWDEALTDLSGEAAWLFDDEVVYCLAKIDDCFQSAVTAYWEYLKAGNSKLDQYDVGPEVIHIDEAHAVFGKLSEHLRYYLYVGDIKRQTHVSATRPNQ